MSLKKTVDPFFQCALSGIFESSIRRTARGLAELTHVQQRDDMDSIHFGIIVGAMEASLRLQNENRPAQVLEHLPRDVTFDTYRSPVLHDDSPGTLPAPQPEGLENERLIRALEIGERRIQELHRSIAADATRRGNVNARQILPPFDEFLYECALSDSRIRLAAAIAALEYGANPDSAANGCWGLLHVVAKAGDIAFAQILVDYGAAIDLRTLDDELTPLMIAAIHGKQEMVSLLLRRGASREAVSYEGESAADLANKYGHREIAETIGRLS